MIRFVLYFIIPYRRINSNLYNKFSGRTYNIAHRGGSLEAPENTLFAFEKVLDICEIIELDVQETLDGIPIVIHNDTLDATSNGYGLVNKYLLRNIKEFDGGYQFKQGVIYPYRGIGVKIPTLEEVFQRFPDHFINIDIKKNSIQLIENVFHLVKQYNREAKTFIGSIKWSVWKRIVKNSWDNENNIYYFPVQEVIRFFLYHLFFLTPLFKPRYPILSIPRRFWILPLVNKRLVRELKQMNILLFVWTINDIRGMRDLMDIGVNGIITDLPHVLDEVLKGK